MDNLAALKRLAVFAAVVDAQGFSAAARRLGMTRSAVSRQVSQLEEELGTRLLHRTTRSLSLTDDGALILADCRAVCETSERVFAVLRARRSEPSGTLRITAPLGLGEAFLAPLLGGFASAHPQVSLHVTLSDEVVDLVAAGIDVAIRGGALQDSALRVRRIGPLDLVVAASPSYLASSPPLKEPADLTAHTWVTYTPLGVPNRPTFRRPGHEPITVRPTGRLQTNNGGVLRHLLLSGQGAGLLPRFYVARDLAAGALVDLLPAWTLATGGIYAVHPHVRHVPLRVQAFIEHLVGAWPTAEPIQEMLSR